MQILVVEGSTRTPSSTCEHVEALLAANHATAQAFHLRETRLPLFVDARVQGDWNLGPALEEMLEAMLGADLIILASPLYWYSVSHLMKNFLDHWTYYLRHPKYQFTERMRGKKFYPVIVGSDPDPAGAAPAFAAIRLSVAYVQGTPLPGFYGLGHRDGHATAETKAAIEQVVLAELM